MKLFLFCNFTGASLPLVTHSSSSFILILTKGPSLGTVTCFTPPLNKGKRKGVHGNLNKERTGKSHDHMRHLNQNYDITEGI